MPTMAVPATPASHMNFLRVNEALTAISSGSREPVKKSCSGLLLGGHTGYDV
jgi:hypothetical protein